MAIRLTTTLNMMLLAMLLLLFAATADCQAQETIFTWDLSSSDSWLNPADGGYRLFCRHESESFNLPHTKDNNAEFIMGSVVPGVNTITIGHPGRFGNLCFRVDAFSENEVSALSNEVCKEFPIDAPGTLTVTDDSVVLRLTFPKDSDTKWSLNLKADGKELKGKSK